MTEKNKKAMELHPLCTYFPRMTDDEFNSLKANLQDNGQTHPIYTLDGMILDGGNRYRALCELGMSPVMLEYTGSNPTQFILSSNLLRRHLTQGQSAAIVSASQSWINAQAATQSNTVQLATATDRAKQSGAGQRTQQLADKLVKEAPAELVKEVIDGKKSLNKAIKEIAPPKLVAPKPELVPIIEQEELQATPKILDAEPSVMFDAAIDEVKQLEVKQLTELNGVLNRRINELMAERDAAIKTANHWREQFLSLEAKFNQSIAN